MEQPINIETAERDFKFQTLGDPALVKMLTAARRMVNEIMAGGSPRWLSFCGVSGTGKTHLAREIYRMVVRKGTFRASLTADEQEICYACAWEFWPKMASFMQKGLDIDDYYHAKNVKFLVLDDIGAVRDGSGHITSKLGELLGVRDGKWTVITANLLPADIAAKLDTRIASRMIRGRNMLVQVQTQDYALRKQ